MAIRVKLLIKSRSSSKEVTVNALVNTGYETVKPQLLIPVSLARELGLWPPPSNRSLFREYFTSGGSIRNILLEDELFVKVVVEYSTSEILCDAVISTIEDEVLISDKLASKLGIIIYDIGEGIWRLKTDQESVRRRSERPQLWS